MAMLGVFLLARARAFRGEAPKGAMHVLPGLYDV